MNDVPAAVANDQAIALSIEYSGTECDVLVGRTMDEGDGDG